MARTSILKFLIGDILYSTRTNSLWSVLSPTKYAHHKNNPVNRCPLFSLEFRTRCERIRFYSAAFASLANFRFLAWEAACNTLNPTKIIGPSTATTVAMTRNLLYRLISIFFEINVSVHVPKATKDNKTNNYYACQIKGDGQLIPLFRWLR